MKKTLKGWKLHKGKKHSSACSSKRKAIGAATASNAIAGNVTADNATVDDASAGTTVFNPQPTVSPQSVATQLEMLKRANANSDDASPDDIPIPKIPPLPHFFEKVMALYPENLHGPVVLSMLSILGFFATRVRFNYLQNRVMPLTFLTFVMAPFASNKSFTTHLWNIFSYRLKAAEKLLAKKAEAERLSRVNSASDKEKVTTKFPLRLLASKITPAAIFKQMEENPGVHQMLHTEEVKSLRQTNTTSYGELPYMLCQAFDGSEVSKATCTDLSANVRTEALINTLICGTNHEMFRLFGDGEDGLASRASICLLPSTLDQPIARFYKPSPELQAEIDQVVDRLSEEGVNTPDNLVEYYFPMFEKFFDDSLEKSRLEYIETQDELWRKFAFRSHNIGYRAAAIGWLVSGKSDEVMNEDYTNVSDDMQRILNLAQWVTLYVQTMQYYVMGPKVEKALEANRVETPSGCRVTSFFSDMPDRFYTEDISEMRQRKNMPVVQNLYTITSRWAKLGLIERCPDNPKMWQKVNTVASAAHLA